MYIVHFLFLFSRELFINFVSGGGGGHKEMSSISADQIEPSYMSPNAGKGAAGSQPMSTAVHIKPK